MHEKGGWRELDSVKETVKSDKMDSEDLFIFKHGNKNRVISNIARWYTKYSNSDQDNKPIALARVR